MNKRLLQQTIKQQKLLLRTKKQGFTLVEVLLTSILSVALLSTLWALFSIHLRLFETGHTNVEQSQLVRALMQQISDDLHSTIQAIQKEKTRSPAEFLFNSVAPDNSPTTLDRNVEITVSQDGAAISVKLETPDLENPPADFQTLQPAHPPGLIGTEYSLRMDVLLAATPAPWQHEINDTTSSRSRAPNVPELQTITYSFQEPILADELVLKTAPGLLRRQKPWGMEQTRPSRPKSLIQNSPLSSDPKSQPFQREPIAAEPLPLEEDTLEEEEKYLPDRFTDMRAPEVVAMKFRYFDGIQWNSSWNSHQRRALPVAVEVAMQVRTFDHLQVPRQSDFAEDSAEDDRGPEEPKQPIYRLVIYLDGPTERNNFSDPLPMDTESEIYSPEDWPGFLH